MTTLMSGAGTASATDATWSGSGSDWNSGANWADGSVPDGVATFSGATPTTITTSAPVNIDEISFTSLAPVYTFVIENTGFDINGAGIVNASSNIPIFKAGDGNCCALFEFHNTSSAGNATITTIGGGRLNFHDSSTAGNATINAGDTMNFLDNSSAENAVITTGNAVLFFQSDSTAANAILNIQGARLFFLDNSWGGNAKLTVSAGVAADFSASTGPAGDSLQTIGSLGGAGVFYLGPNQLTVGSNNLSTEVSGNISDCGPTGTACQASNDDIPSTGGSLVKTGTGTLTLSGANIYTGPTIIEQGSLVVNGSIESSDLTTVKSGATLMGTGTLGAVTVESGGLHAPGNSIGTEFVAGPYMLDPGAILEIELDATPNHSDRVVVTGLVSTVNINDAILQVLAQSGNYAPSTQYVIIDNQSDNNVTGTFAQVTTNLAFLAPTVAYNVGVGGNDVVLTLERVAVFNSVARTRNQTAVADALDRFPTDNPLFLTVLNQTADGARQAFDALSGEIHASVSGVLADDSRYLREAVLGRLKQATYTSTNASQVAALGAGGPHVATLDAQAMALGYDDKSLAAPPSAPGLAFWTRAYGAWGDFDGDRNAASASRDLGGFVSGLDARVGGTWRIGLGAGGSWSDVSVSARHSAAEVESFHLAGYGGGLAGPFALRGGGAWSWNEIDTSRVVIFPGFVEREKTGYDADTGQIFGEAAYPIARGRSALEPFAGLAFVSIDTGSFKENGAEAALSSRGFDQDVGYSTLGLRAATTMAWNSVTVTPHVSAAWQHAFDDVTPGAALAFAATGTGFTVTGVPLAEDTALIEAGLDLSLGPNTTAGVAYAGQFGDGVTDNGIKGRFTWLF